MRMLRACRLRDEDNGAYAILYAILITLLVGVTALVLDIAGARLDRRTNRAATDAGVIAGVQALKDSLTAVGSPQQGCEDAFNAVAAALRLGAISTADCGSFPPDDNACLDDGQAGGPTAANTATTVVGERTISVVWPVPDGHGLMTYPDVEKWQDPPLNQELSADDGASCERVGVVISQQRPAPFGSVIGTSRLDTTSHSVAVVQIGYGPGGETVPLVILDLHACNALTTSGGGSGTGGIRVLSDGTLPGLIAVDSDGSGAGAPPGYDCGSKYVINATTGGGSPTHIWAYDSPTGGKAQILTRADTRDSVGNAYPPGQTTGCVRAPGTVAPYPDLVGKVCPKPRRTGAIVGDSFIVKRYNCPTALCGVGKNHIDTLESYQSGITNGNAVSLGWYVVNSCPGGDADIGADLLAAGYAAGTPIYVKDSNCQIKGTVKFPGSSTVIFAGDVKVTTSGACLLLNNQAALALDVATLCTGGAYLHDATNPITDAQPVILRGDLVINSAVLAAPQTFIYQLGSLNLSATSVVWTAPYGANQDRDGNVIAPVPGYVACSNVVTSPGFRSCFEDLATWNTLDTDAVGSHPSNSLGGQALLNIEGTWYLPKSQFNFSGDSTQSQRHAQFVTKRLSVVGGGELIMVPDATRSSDALIDSAGLIR